MNESRPFEWPKTLAREDIDKLEFKSVDRHGLNSVEFVVQFTLHELNLIVFLTTLLVIFIAFSIEICLKKQ